MEMLSTTIKRSKLSYFGHICRFVASQYATENRPRKGVETWMDVVAEGRTYREGITPMSESTGQRRHCCASLTAGTDWRPYRSTHTGCPICISHRFTSTIATSSLNLKSLLSLR